MSSSITIERSPASSAGHVGWPHASAPPQHPDLVAERITMHLESLVPQGRARCLEISDNDPTLAEHVEERLPRAHWQHLDARLGRFDGRALPFADGDFDVALLCDALGGARRDAARLLAEAGRVAQHVLVKDRFGGRLAEHYFTHESFGRLVTEQGLVITALDCGLERYLNRPAAASRAHTRPFIAVLSRA